MGENLKVVLAKISTLSLTVLLHSSTSAWHTRSHFQSRKLGPGFILLTKNSQQFVSGKRSSLLCLTVKNGPKKFFNIGFTCSLETVERFFFNFSPVSSSPELLMKTHGGLLSILFQTLSIKTFQNTSFFSVSQGRLKEVEKF
jgi:hypothetical protein